MRSSATAPVALVGPDVVVTPQEAFRGATVRRRAGARGPVLECGGRGEIWGDWCAECGGVGDRAAFARPCSCAFRAASRTARASGSA